MLRTATILCVIAAIAAIPVSQVNKVSTIDEMTQGQNLISIASSDSSEFKDFMPLVKQVVITSAVVVPGVKKHNKEKVGMSTLIQTPESDLSELEKDLPTSTDMLDAMIAIGKVMGSSSGFNPIMMMTNVVGGRKEMETVVDDIMRFPFHFPMFTEEQLLAAEQVLVASGLGFINQEQALEGFMKTMTEEQVKMIEDMQKNVFDKLVNSMTTNDGKPTEALVAEVKSQMRDMKRISGNTDKMPRELKELVEEDISKGQSLISVAASETNKFKDFMPLVKNVIITSGVIVPAVKKHNLEKIDGSMLVQTSDSSLSDLEKDLPTSIDMLDAMISIGRVMGSSSGFNPIQMVTNVVGGREDMQKIVDEMMHFPFRFPDITEEQLVAAEQVLIASSLGFIDQDQAMNGFLKVLTPEQNKLIDDMQKNVFEKLLNSMTTADGKPTQALVEEIKSQMRDVEKKTGSTEKVPQELKDLVVEASKQA